MSNYFNSASLFSKSYPFLNLLRHISCWKKWSHRRIYFQSWRHNPLHKHLNPNIYNISWLVDKCFVLLLLSTLYSTLSTSVDTGCPKKKRGISVLGTVWGGWMASNQKVEENKPPLKYNFTCWVGFKALYTLYNLYKALLEPVYTLYTTFMADNCKNLYY